ncbi:MAG: ABC transporter substrate-binding protein [Gammaproteobacteria bacterium HGW-Gammaproteobacteria-11]|nr:MAG: ABC transporter substrate-binding protein [Gammaproteobacteria bacterium HGW-Gammaproteobacteria-11]
MKRLIPLLLISCFVQLAHADNTRLTITGASTVAPVIADIARAFEQTNPGTRIDVQTGGSSRGIADTRSGRADIGMISRALYASEEDLSGYPFAMDGISLITHSSNPIDALSHEQIIAIFTGQIINWQEVGGPDRLISVVNKAEGRSTLELFLVFFKLSNSDIKAQVVIGDNQQGIKTVAGNPGAIGYVSIGAAEYESELGTPIKLIPLAGVAPTMAHVADGSFPLSRPLNLVTASPAEGLSARFIEFARSNSVHGLINEHFFVPLANAE